MTVLVPGIDAASGELLIPPMADGEFAASLAEQLPQRWGQAQKLAAAATAGRRLRGVIPRKQAPDRGDPRVVGWTYLVRDDDPLRDDYVRALAPLARHRGMSHLDKPLVFSGEPPEDWQDWVEHNYASVERSPQQYVLIVGGPDQVPFHFQALLANVASVGRLAFDDVGSLEAYVEKVLRLEADGGPTTRREALVFATDRGQPDPTYFSRRYMADPLASRVRSVQSAVVTTLTGERATAPALVESLTTRRSAVIYTAGHGAARPRGPLAEQRLVNGAIVCTAEAGATQQSLFTAADVPVDTPVAEGAIVFQFACFGAGTPAESDYMHWLGRVGLSAGVDFVAALPKRLLAHPRGPLAFVGHVDLAWLHAFDDPDDPDIEQAYHPRLAPFVKAVETLLAPQPVGLAMEAMNNRFAVGNNVLAIAFDRQKRGKLPDGPQDHHKLVNAFITRSDAQNYVVLGDPAVYPRMSDD